MGGGKMKEQQPGDIEGLWTIVFAVGINASGGIVVFKEGTILGGDSQFFYVGEYSETNGNLDASIMVKAFTADNRTVFGVSISNFELRITGTVSGGQIEGTASLPTGQTLGLRLTKRA
jgi:hypothetical protein